MSEEIRHHSEFICTGSRPIDMALGVVALIEHFYEGERERALDVLDNIINTLRGDSKEVN